MQPYERIVRIMSDRVARKLAFGRQLLFGAAGFATIALPVALGFLSAPLLRAQSSTTDWEKAAGSKQTFEVVSIKQNKSGLQPGHMPTSNIPLGDGDGYSPTGGLFSTNNFPLISYMGFAYKLTPSQIGLLELPKWAAAERFDIEARANGNPTKDQYRLMMQSLLADRFKLAVHFETRQTPVLELVLVKPGKTGPQLRPHLDDPPCAAASASSSATVAGGFPTPCGEFIPLQASTSGRQSMGARNLTWGQFANLLGLMGRLDRPVLDKTGLAGNFDFVLEWTPQPNRPAPDFQPDESGPTFLEAVQDQLGLKLESQTRLMEILVLDHVEEPSSN
jgi:uncharacterized protein (TIGR03435 family)